MNLPLNINIQQILLHLLNFVILAGGLYILLYKPITAFLDKRKAYFEEQEKALKEGQKEIHEAKEKYHDLIANAEAEIEQMKKNAEAEIDKLHDIELSKAQDEARKIINHARDSADREHDEIIANISNEIKEMAVVAAEKAMLKSQGNPFDEFLHLAERSILHDTQTDDK